MPSVYFWKCDCGIRWRALRETAGGLQLVACLCDRRHEIPGTASEIHYSYKNNPTADVHWNRASQSRLKDPDERNIA